jgi:hypothetical protein
MATIEEVLLRVTGDSASAERTLEQLATELEAFGQLDPTAELQVDASDVRTELEKAKARLAAWARETATATADVDTGTAREDLNALRVQLTLLNIQEANPEVDVQIAKAIAQIDLLEAELAVLDARDVEIDVDVRRGVVERIGALVGEVGRLGGGLSDLGGEAEAAGGGMGGLTARLGPLAGSLGEVGIVAAVLIPVVVSLAGAVAALVASFAAAVAGAGALATAAGSLLAPAIVLGIGAVQRFKATVNQAGSAAHDLAGVAHQAGQAFQRMIGPGADAVFRGAAAGLRSLIPLLASLRPAFTTFGRAVGGSLRTLGREFARPAWQAFFRLLARAAAQVTPIVTRVFISFARILRNIATAAMPFLIKGLREFSRWLRHVADDSKGIDLSGPIHALGLWLRLTYQLGRVFLGFIRAASGAGGGLVEWLTKGAKALADWLNSTEGKNRLAQFFKDVLPLARDLIVLFLQLALALIQIGQFLAPVLDPFVKVLGLVFKALNFVLGLLNKIPAAVRVAFILGPIGQIILLVRHLGGVLGLVGDGFRLVRRIAGNVVEWIRDRWGGIGHILGAPFRAAWGIVKDVAGFIKGKVGDVISWIKDHWRQIGDVLAAPWRLVGRVVRVAVEFIIDKAGDVVDWVENRWGDLKGLLEKPFHGIARMVRGALRGVKGAFEFIVGGLIDGLNVLIDAFNSVFDRSIDPPGPGPSFSGIHLDPITNPYGGQRGGWVTSRGIVGFQGGGGAGGHGPGPGPRDTVDAKLQVGEFVIPKNLVDAVRANAELLLGLLTNFKDAALDIWQKLRERTTEIVTASLREVNQTSRDLLNLTREVFANGVDAILNAFDRLPSGLSRTASQVARLFGSLARVIRRAANFIMHAVSRLTNALGSNLKLPSLDLELPDLSPKGFYRGGVARKPGYFAGEEAPAHPEVILATNPRYRDRNLALWAQAGRMLGVPGFAQGGIYGGMQRPIVALIQSVIKRFGGSMSSGYRPGDPGYHGRGMAADWVGGDWVGAGRFLNSIGRRLLEGIHATPPGVQVSWKDGQRVSPSFWGAATWGDHHSHIHMAIGRMVGALGAAARQIGRLVVKGAGPVKVAGQAAVDFMRDAGNRFIERHQPALTTDAAVPDVGKGSVAQVAGRVARALRSPHRAVLALFEALWAESGMCSTSGNVLQLLPATAAGTGIGLSDVAGQVAGFLQRGYFGKGGAIELARTTNWPAYVIAQAVQGSAFASGSNYAAQRGAALATLHSLGYRGFATGGLLRKLMLGLIGGEAGASELALLPTGTQIIPSDITARLSKALMGSTEGRPLALAGVGAEGGGSRGDTIQNFIIQAVPGTGQPDPQITAAKLAILMRQRRGDF